jgi:hypothetical protein
MSNLTFYVLGDGGRMESDAHYEERNDCGVRSLVFLTELTYDEAWDIAQKAGRQPYCGFDARMVDQKCIWTSIRAAAVSGRTRVKSLSSSRHRAISSDGQVHEHGQ